MKTLGLLIAAALLLPAVSEATGDFRAGQYPGTGDGDPFPLQCVDFSGTWKADNGARYTISQQNCKYLKINMVWGNFEEDTISIVPDNKSRGIPGRDRSAVRHRWNSPRTGTMLESHRSFVSEGYRYTEVVIYELEASAGIMLETSYSTAECLARPGKIERGYEQQVFRRMAHSPEGVKPGKSRK